VWLLLSSDRHARTLRVDDPAGFRSMIEDHGCLPELATQELG
jgi:hypothetical protein